MNELTSLLYVDDEPLNTMLFKAYFKQIFDVHICDSGLKGLEKLRLNPEIRVVISDMKMPNMNGIEFIQLAKNEFPNIAYFILTGYDINEEITNALNSNLILKYFRKPFNEREIEKTIKEFLQNQNNI